MRSFLATCTLALWPFSALAEIQTLTLSRVTDWKAVYGTVAARNQIPARARIGGTLTVLSVVEGDRVVAGQVLAQVEDEKLAFQLSALTAQRAAAAAQQANARAEVQRGESLLQQGATTTQRLDALRTQLNVLTGQIAALDAQAEVIRQSQAEGAVLAPAAGRIVEVPITRGAVVLPGETIAHLATGGTFLRLAIPERHAAELKEGDPILIENAKGQDAGAAQGKLVKVYPLIADGRVVADVEVQGLSDRFIGNRLLVRLPVGSHPALLVPSTAILHRAGLDFVAVDTGAGPVMRVVVPGQRQMANGVEEVEILSGLAAGDRFLTVPPASEASQ